MISEAVRPRVVVIGAGFAGLAAARRLDRADVDVLVVDRTNHHLFQPLLYQVATGILSPGEIAPSTRAVLGRHRNVSVTLADVTDVDLDQRVVTASGVDGEPRQIGYDYLVVAAGARDSYFGHDDWAQHLYPMKTLAQAVALRSRILAAYEQAAQAPSQQALWTTFVIVGGGPTGVELAGQLATIERQFRRDFRRIDTRTARIVLVEAGDELVPSFSASLRQHAHRKLTEMGVDVRLGATAVQVDDDGIDIRSDTGSSERIHAATVAWAAGVQASALGRLLGEASGAEVDRKGRVAVNPDCSLPGHPEIFVIGDLAKLDDVPGLCEPAMQEGWYVARVIRRRVRGRPAPKQFHYRDLGSMATISGGDAIADAFGLRLTGVLGKVAWAFVHIAFLAGWGNRLGVLTRWAHDLTTGSRTERVILQGVGDMEATGRPALSEASDQQPAAPVDHPAMTTHPVPAPPVPAHPAPVGSGDVSPGVQVFNRLDKVVLAITHAGRPADSKPIDPADARSIADALCRAADRAEQTPT